MHATRVYVHTIYLLFFVCTLWRLPFGCMHKMAHLFVQRILALPSTINDVIRLFDRDFFPLWKFQLK